MRERKEKLAEENDNLGITAIPVQDSCFSSLNDRQAETGLTEYYKNLNRTCQNSSDRRFAR